MINASVFSKFINKNPIAALDTTTNQLNKVGVLYVCNCINFSHKFIDPLHWWSWEYLCSNLYPILKGTLMKSKKKNVTCQPIWGKKYSNYSQSFITNVGYINLFLKYENSTQNCQCFLNRTMYNFYMEWNYVKTFRWSYVNMNCWQPYVISVNCITLSGNEILDSMKMLCI